MRRRHEMKSTEARGIEAILRRPVELDLSLNELRIIVGCLGAVSYMAEADGEPYLDPDGRRLMERLEGLYRDQVENRDLGSEEPSRPRGR
jgi:hypothetical protein